MSQKNIDAIAKKLLKFPNVTGYAKTLQKRRKDDKIIDEWVIQIHVVQKVPERELRKIDILPKSIDDMPIDVVAVGPLKAPPEGSYETQTKKTDAIDPLVAGISIGNAAITAGTLGWFMEKNGEVFLGSNAHVLSEDPKNPTSSEKRILQPGKYDGGVVSVATYYWHKQLQPLAPSGCQFAQGVAQILNLISATLGRKSRFQSILQEANHIDFAVAKMLVPYKKAFFDTNFTPSTFKFVGFGFAGSDQISLICRQKYILMEDYRPSDFDVTDVEIGDTLHKTGRTSCHSTAKVVVPSAYEIVGYGTYQVAFDDVILSGHLLDPGDSGSSVWKEVS